MLIGPGAVQDGLGIDLVRFFFRLVVWVRFFDPLELLLGLSWAASGPVLGHLGLVFGLLGADFWFVSAVLVSFSIFVCRCSLVTFRFVDFRCRVSLFDSSMLPSDSLRGASVKTERYRED